MSDSARLHEEKYRAAKATGLTGWGGLDRISRLPQILEERFFSFKDTPTSGKLLELGCGAGNLSMALARRGFDVYGVDFAESAIEWARENAKLASCDIDFQVANVVNLSQFSDEKFDVVYDSNCFHCIIGDQRALALAEWRRVLKATGLLFISSLCALNEDPAFPNEFDPVTRILTESGVAYRFIPTQESIEDELRSAGFEIVHRAVRTESPFGHINLHAVRSE